MINSLLRVSLLLMLAGLAGCGGLRVEESSLHEGVFMVNSRMVKPSAIVGEVGDPKPKPIISFKDLEAKPQLRFRGRLSHAGGRHTAEGTTTVTNIETMEFDAFHASSAQRAELERKGILEPGSRTFREAVENSESVLIYVHGFNNSAQEAAASLLKIEAEVERQGRKVVPLLYTWPTDKNMPEVVVGGALAKLSMGHADALLNDVYLSDRKNIDVAAHALYLLYDELADNYPNLKVDLVAHSMGSEVVMKSFLSWHYHQLMEGKRTGDNLRILNRVVLVGADIGLDLFKVLAQPASYTANEILVYINPRDSVLVQSAQINTESRVGDADLDQGLPGIPAKFTFVQLADPLVKSPVKVVESLLVNHNPLRNPKVLEHACEYLLKGQIAQNTPGLYCREEPRKNLEGSAAKYYVMRFEAPELMEAVDAITKPIQVAADAAGEVVGGAVQIVGQTGQAIMPGANAKPVKPAAPAAMP